MEYYSVLRRIKWCHMWTNGYKWEIIHKINHIQMNILCSCSHVDGKNKIDLNMKY